MRTASIIAVLIALLALVSPSISQEKADPREPQPTDSVAKLLKDLEQKEPLYRARAISILGQRNAHEAIPKLMEMLKDGEALRGSDNFVGAHAATALVAITGRNFHIDQKAWQTWWEEHQKGRKLFVRDGIAELLEDNAATLLPKLTNPSGDPGEGRVEQATVFSGKSSIKILPLQRFHSRIDGWTFRITEKPALGEFRYLRFAWKSEGTAGLMIQFHDARDWHIRYTAGTNTHGWTTKFVSDQPPAEWTVVTRDFYQDFGERTITGMALTVFGGGAGYFDHIYLGRTLDDLDRIDATGLSTGKPPEPNAAELERLWNDLAGRDSSKAYLAFWTLKAAAKQSIPFLKGKLLAGKGETTVKQIHQWIKELDDDKFAVREKASRELASNLEAASPLLEQKLRSDPSDEVRRRIETLLATRKGLPSQRDLLAKVIRVLEFQATPEARQCLMELARNEHDAWLAETAGVALKRGETGRTK